MRPQEIFAKYLAENNLKMTSQRMVILDVFLAMDGHPDSDELYQIVRRTDPSIGQATVYRTLKLLSDSGLAREVDFNDGVTRYEHGWGHDHHDHLICENCGKKLEVMDPKIEKLQEELAAKHNFTLTGHKMYLYGLCKNCRK